MYKKILISGGWGYRNLGDDSILLATIDLLRNRFPEAELIVTSYCVNDTKEIIGNTSNIKIIPSFYRLIFNSLYETKYYGKKTKLFSEKSKLNKILIKLSKKIEIYIVYINLYLLKIDLFEKLILRKLSKNVNYKNIKNNVDLFIMSGGGYFNESWNSSFISHYLELKFVKKNNIKSVLIGQTIGPFNSKICRRLAYSCMSGCSSIMVRDLDSYNELDSLGIKVEKSIIPDLVLSKNFKTNNKNNILTFIVFGEYINEKKKDLLETFKLVERDLGYKVVISISQSWKGPIENAKLLNNYLNENGCSSSLLIPRNHKELEELLSTSKVVISQNLHGLILAWRNNSSIIALNDRRKFKTFMDIIEKPQMLLPIKILDSTKLFSLIVEASNYENQSSQINNLLIGKIEEDFNNCLKNLN
jgi:polysaccharide pyruvyl transferase WcaK-like protein